MKFKVGELVKIHTRIELEDFSVLSRLRRNGCIFRLVERDGADNSTGNILWRCAIIYRGKDEEHKDIHTLWLYEDELQGITDSPSLRLLLRE